MSGEHSILPPSSAHIWRWCTAWPQQAQQFPQPETEDTLKGTAIHQVGALLIGRGMRGGIGSVLTVGDQASNGVIITQEMVECAELWASVFLKEYNSRITKGGIQHQVELPVWCPSIHARSMGTPDSWLYDPDHGRKPTLIIYDCKGGHVHINAFENWQEINYTSGIADKLGLTDPSTEVWFCIVQPFSYHSDGPVRTWKTTLGALQQRYWPELAAAAAEAMGPNAKLQTGHHCRRCHLRVNCPAALQCGMALHETTMIPVMQRMSPEALGLQYAIVDRAMEQMTALSTGFGEQIKALIKAGTPVPGWCLQPTAGREEWVKPPKEVKAMGNLFGINLAKDDELITPNQARKAGVPNEILAVYSERRTGLELVPESTDRVRQIFQGA